MTATHDRAPVAPRHGMLLDHEFELVQGYVYRRTGIRFAANKRYFVDKRVRTQMERHGFTDFDGWFATLRRGVDTTGQDLVNALTVNETYFLREDYQFDCLLRSVLPAVLADRRRLGTADAPIRILSLPAATGEEPYSIALRLLEDWPQLATVDVSLTGADIDTTVLALARQGRYGERAVHRVPDDLRRRWFRREADGYQLHPDVREAVSFEQVNVCDPVQTARYRQFDVVFCRNLLIYFDEVSARLATDNLFDVLRGGGFLFLGHSESMSRISPIFTPRRFPDALVYQKPADGKASHG